LFSFAAGVWSYVLTRRLSPNYRLRQETWRLPWWCNFEIPPTAKTA